MDKWIEHFYKTAGDYKQVPHIVKFAKKMDALLTNKDWDKIDSLMQNINIKRVSNQIMSALVAYTSTARKNIPSWKNTADKIAIEIDNRGKNPKSVLIGLLD